MLTIATCRTYPQPSQNLLPLADILNHQSILTRFDIWQSRPSDLFLLSLCAWGYAAEPQASRRWPDGAEKSGQRFVNPPPLTRWNMNKEYPCGLATWGADVIPSMFTPPEDQTVQNVLRERGWQEAVIRPTVGQSGYAVARITAASPPPDWPAYPQGVVVQSCIREIKQASGTSLIFFNGALSHAVLRRPPQDEWRVNPTYGVEIRLVAPSEIVVRTARDMLDLLPQVPVYAQVDGTIIGGKLLLDELGLIESALYLHAAQGTAEHFAVVLVPLLFSVPSQEQANSKPPLIIETTPHV